MQDLHTAYDRVYHRPVDHFSMANISTHGIVSAQNRNGSAALKHPHHDAEIDDLAHVRMFSLLRHKMRKHTSSYSSLSFLVGVSYSIDRTNKQFDERELFTAWTIDSHR